MPLSEEIQNRIRDVFAEKVPDIGSCPLCRERAWQLADGGFVNIELSESPYQVVVGGPILPSVAIVCKTCGNTAFLNLLVLGLGDLLEESEDTDQPAPEAAEG